MYWLIVLCILLFTPAVDAQEIVTIPPGDDVIISIQKGEPAPYDGQLFSVDTSIRWSFWLQQYKLRLKEDVEKERRDCKIKLDYKDKELTLRVTMHKEIERDLTERLKRSEKGRLEAEDAARNPSFWRSFEFGLITGVVISSVVAVLTAWGTNLI